MAAEFSWDNQPGDEGEQLLQSYIRGDRVIAYAKGYGAVGWGVLENPQYRLVSPGSSDDRRAGDLRHRLTITWKMAAMRLEDGIAPAELRDSFELYHPISTSVKIEYSKVQRLIEAMNARFA